MPSSTLSLAISNIIQPSSLSSNNPPFCLNISSVSPCTEFFYTSLSWAILNRNYCICHYSSVWKLSVKTEKICGIIITNLQLMITSKVFHNEYSRSFSFRELICSKSLKSPFPQVLIIFLILTIASPVRWVLHLTNLGIAIVSLQELGYTETISFSSISA